MLSSTFQILGKLIGKQTRHGIAGLFIQAWDKDRKFDDPLGWAFSDENGDFEITFHSRALRDDPKGRGPDLYVKVSREKNLLHSTEAEVKWDMAEHEASFTVEIDEDLPANFTVRGHVVQPDGAPKAGVNVKAFERHLRKELELGEAKTDKDGTFVIQYTKSRPSRQQKGYANLIVRATNRTGKEIASSPLNCKPGVDEAVTLVVGNGKVQSPSEYEQLIENLNPHLNGKVTLPDMNRDDLDFLVRCANINRRQLATLIIASRLTRDTGIHDWFFYALGRQGVMLRLEALLAYPLSNLKDSITRAMAANIVPRHRESQLNKMIGELKQVLVRHAFAKQTEGIDQVPLGRLLETSLVEKTVQQEFLGHYLEHEGSPDEFWRKLEKEKVLDREAINDLRFTLHLGKLTRFHLPLLKQLKKLRRKGELTSLRDLAAFDRSRWRQLLETAAGEDGVNIPPDIPGATPKQRLNNYISMLREPLETLFPSDSLRHAISRTQPENDEIASILRKTPDLDLYWSNVDAYFREHDNIPITTRDGAIDRIKTLQRLLRVSPRSDHVLILQEAGFNSAYSIARASKRKFTQLFTKTAHQLEGVLDSAYRVTQSPEKMVLAGVSVEEVAAGVQNAAEQVAAGTLKLIVEVLSGNQQPDAIGGPADQQKAMWQAFIRDNPDWETLFGSVDFCACEHCRSVYSPAAYYVDLLRWLDNLSIDPKTGKLKYPEPEMAAAPIKTLLQRRPDLANIQLTCENTNTVLPYIDLVNEGLESFLTTHLETFSDGTTHWSDTPISGKYLEARDTGAATAAELRAVPQYIIPEVYDLLATTAFYPMDLPYNHWLAVIRAYLAHLGTSRAEVVEVFGQSQTEQVLTEKLASEGLGLSLAQYRIIVGDPLSGPIALKTFYGYDSLTSDSGLVAEIEKRSVGDFLKHTALSISDLEEVLKTRFINEGGSIKLSNPKGDCDLSQTFLKGLSITALDKLHRFLRLWRALNWSVADLDRAIFALGGSLDLKVVERLQAAYVLTQTLSQPVSNLLALWANLDTYGEDSLYAQLFLLRPLTAQDPQTGTPATAGLFKLNTSGSDLADTGQKLADHLAPVFAALQFSAADFEAIKEFDPNLTPDAKLDLKNLSLLYRYGVLARVLRIRVKDLVTLIRLAPAGVIPFDYGPAGTVAFVQLVYRVQESDFSIPLLNYLFRHIEEPTRHPAPTRALIETTLTTIAEGLSQIFQDTVPVVDSTGETLKQQLSQLIPLLTEPAQGEEGKFIRPPELPNMVDNLNLEKVNPAVGETFLKKAHNTLIKDLSSSFLDVDGDDQIGKDVIDWIKEPLASDETEAERFQDNLAALRGLLLPWLRVRLQRGLVIQTLADALGVEQLVVQLLLENETIFDPDPATTATALQVFLTLIDDTGKATKIDPDQVQDAPVRTFVLLFKAAAIVNGFAMPAPELNYISQNSSDFNEFSLSKLPMKPPSDESASKKLFAGWQSLSALCDLRRSLPSSEKSLVDYLKNGNPTNELLAEVTGWEQATIEDLKDEGFSAVKIADLTAMQRAVKLIKRVGASAEQMVALATDPPSHEQAETVVQILKAHYDQKSWLEVAERLNDPLREERRDMLVDFLAARMTKPHPLLKKQTPNYPVGEMEAVKELQSKLNFALQTYSSSPPLPLIVDGKFGPKTEQAIKAFQTMYGLPITLKADPATWAMLDRVVGDVFERHDLLEYFLIDVEMNSCMLTSRIKQGISAVQLFVQRCLLNLEATVSPEEIDEDQWEWMKNYRVWEANRKVFLYPENWIEPELRDDKSPFFNELETELLQNELNDANVEQAVINYLHKLDEVARLDIRGMCKEEKIVGTAEKEIYHVFGRTWDPPYIYYYRRGEFAKKGLTAETWSAWQRVDLDIQGDHLIPVAYGNRLFLFWLVFERKPVSRLEQDESAGNGEVDAGDSNPPQEQWEISLHRSEFLDKGWSSKFVAKAKLFHEVRYIHKVYKTFSWLQEPIAQNLGYSQPDITNTLSRYGARAEIKNDILTIHVGEERIHLGFPMSPFSTDAELEYDAIGSFVMKACGDQVSSQNANNWEVYGMSDSTSTGLTWISKNATFHMPKVAAKAILSPSAAYLKSQPFMFVMPQADLDSTSSKSHYPFFYHDSNRTFFSSYFVRPVVVPGAVPQLPAKEDTTMEEIVLPTPVDNTKKWMKTWTDPVSELEGKVTTGILYGAMGIPGG